MDQTIPTSLGPLTPSQIADEVEFSWYRNQRYLYAIPAARLANFVGEVPGAALEARYLAWYREKMRETSRAYLRDSGRTSEDLPDCYGVGEVGK